MAECPTVAIIQHESGEILSESESWAHLSLDEDVLQVAHHYFENAIAYFTRRVNKTISLSESRLFIKWTLLTRIYCTQPVLMEKLLPSSAITRTSRLRMSATSPLMRFYFYIVS